MSQKNEAAILIGALAITGAIVAGGGWWLWNRFQGGGTVNPPVTQTQSNGGTDLLPLPNQPQANNTFTEPQQVAAGTTIKIDGSTSMVNINEALKTKFQQTYPGTVVETDAQGSDRGIVNLILGKVDLSASSRPLTPQEQSQGLAAVPIANDAIAVIVGTANPFQASLSPQSVRGIFSGQINNWSEVSGLNTSIRVINRPSESGTRQIFQSLVLEGGEFGQGNNFQTMDRDATTPIIRALGNDGISYATYVQVKNQQTARILPIDGILPTDQNYPLRRQLYYVYKTPPSPQVEAFLGFATSPTGQAAIATIE
ncbi:MAG: phosphate ABC transporter substrate-binding protein [Synechocystis sp.]|nr:phosphate ABC transporter substrate-binding protein [Synechocystis sp.]